MSQRPLELKRVAVICSEDISDGLMMMVASHRLFLEGVEVTTFHDSLRELSLWFVDHSLAPRPLLANIEEAFSHFDLIILQYDSSHYAKSVIHQFKEGSTPRLSIFYPTYSKYRHSRLTPWDRVFNKELSMVDNISFAISSLLHVRDHSKNNGLLPPIDLSHRKYPRRVAILPSPLLKKKYQIIADKVKEMGFEPLFISRDNIAEGASIIYESGFFIGPDSDLCHLASNLQIPTLVVGFKKRPFNLWRPGWLRSSNIHFPRFVPRALEHFTLTSKVLSGFKTLITKHR